MGYKTMKKYKLGEMEQRFADLIWQHEPISSGSLSSFVKELNWKKSRHTQCLNAYATGYIQIKEHGHGVND